MSRVLTLPFAVVTAVAVAPFVAVIGLVVSPFAWAAVEDWHGEGLWA